MCKYIHYVRVWGCEVLTVFPVKKGLSRMESRYWNTPHWRAMCPNCRGWKCWVDMQ